MSDIRKLKTSLFVLAKSVTIGKLRWSRLRFNSLLEKYRQPVAELKDERLGTCVTVDAYGHPRVVSNFNNGGLARVIFSGRDEEASSLFSNGGFAEEIFYDRDDKTGTFLKDFAERYLERTLTKNVFDSGNISLSFTTMKELSNNAGLIFVFKESVESVHTEADGTSKHSRCDVDKSYVEVLVRKTGKATYEICRLTSSLSRVADRQAVKFLVSESRALAIAEKTMRRKLGQFQARLASSSCEVQANPYRGQLAPIYRFILNLEVEQQLLPVEVIVRGDNGKVVFAKSRILQAESSQSGVAGKALLNVPNRYQNIADQFKDVVIDPSILRTVDGKLVLSNQWIEVYYCEEDQNGWLSTHLVTTMSDDGTANSGTFNWPENTPQAKGVVVYVAYMFLIQLLIECGLKIPFGSKVLRCYAAHPWNIDNDSFYPDQQEIQDGVGDGKFMRKNMVYDLVPDDHELVHWVVYLLRTTDHYIQGNLGGALNEAIADTGATLARYFSWLLSGAKLGDMLTYDKLMHDMEVIGYYCFVANADGFREDNNNLVYPDDLHGTNVHDNCRIPAAATLHTFFAWVDNAISVLQAMQATQGLEPMSKDQALQFVLPNVIKDFLRLILTAIPVLPAHDVTFGDWRKALEDSDQLIFHGAHLSFIAQGFDRHKIKTNTVVLSRLTGFGRRKTV